LANFYFVSEGFQCTANGIFIPKDLKLGEISTKKKTLYNFSFFKKIERMGGY